jgi:hypothetical protein
MTATAHAVRPTVGDPPAARKAALQPLSAVETVARLPAALAAVPAVQRTCEACREEEDPARPMPVAGHLPPGHAMARRLVDVAPGPALVQRRCGSCGGILPDTEVMARLEVGPVDDPYEREADAIAGRVMAMRSPLPEASADAGGPARRRCAACAAKDHEVTARRSELPGTETLTGEEEPRMRATEASPSAGTETIAASDTELTTGGQPLPEATRAFYEDRMGHDLSGVRLHRGTAAESLNASISARAFTYRDHIWLSGAEGTGPSFTMAHELAHVLQQTQPAAAQPRVRRTASGIISDTLYFGEEKTKEKKTHDLAVAHAVKQNGKLMGEVAVPNATRDEGEVDEGQGYADLVLSDPNKLWGLKFKPYLSSATTLPWYAVADGGKTYQPVSINYPIPTKTLHFDGGTFTGELANKKYFSRSAPRWGTTDFIYSAADAPGKYEIGDVKFAGDKDRSGDAGKQAETYAAGFNGAARRYNLMVDQSEGVKNKTAAGTGRTGSSRSNSLARTGFSAAKMTSSASSGDFIALETGLPLSLRKYGKNVLGNFGSTNVSGLTYTGRSYYRQNPTSKHLWEYVFWPDEIKEQDDSTSRKNRRDSLTSASQTLYDQMVTSPTGKKVMPLRQAPVGVQPKKPKKAPPPKVDPFQAQYPTWKEQQKTFTKTFAGYTNSKTGTGKADIAKLAFDTAIRNTVKLLGGKGPDGSTPVQSTTELTTAQAEFNRAELMQGRSGRMLGWMRKTFGATFIKALNIYERLKTKFENFLKGAKKRTGGGGKLGKVIMKVGGVIFGSIIRVLLPQVGAYLVDCVEEAFKSLMQKMMETNFDDITADFEETLRKKYDELAGQIEAKVEAAADAIKTRFGSIYESVMEAWETAGTLLSIARHAFNVARIAACAAGGLETIGISCIIAGADYLLSLIDASPSEHLAAHLLSSCVAQELIREFILGRSIIQNLPREIAETIRSHVKDALPAELKPLICDQIVEAPDLPDPSEIPCEDIETPYQGRPGLTDLSKPPPDFDPDFYNRRPTGKEKRETGKLDRDIYDDSGQLDRSKLPKELLDLLKPEEPPEPGTPEVWDPKDVPPPDMSQAPIEVEAGPSVAEDEGETEAPGQEPATGTGVAQGGETDEGSGDQRSRDQDILPGTLTGPTTTVSAFTSIYPGPSGGFRYGKGDGRTIFRVYIYVQTSDFVTYGPLPIKIKVFDVSKTDKGDRIEFEPDQSYVMRNGTNRIGISVKKRTAALRST